MLLPRLRLEVVYKVALARATQPSNALIWIGGRMEGDPFCGTVLNVCIPKPVGLKSIQQEFSRLLPACHVVHKHCDRGASQGKLGSCTCYASEEEPTRDFGPGQLQLGWFVAVGEIRSRNVKVASNSASYEPHCSFKLRSIALTVAADLRSHEIYAAVSVQAPITKRLTKNDVTPDVCSTAVKAIIRVFEKVSTETEEISSDMSSHKRNLTFHHAIDEVNASATIEPVSVETRRGGVLQAQARQVSVFQLEAAIYTARPQFNRDLDAARLEIEVAGDPGAAQLHTFFVDGCPLVATECEKAQEFRSDLVARRHGARPRWSYCRPPA